MANQLSERIQRVKPSPTLAISALAGQLKAQGRDIISLGLGEPDFETPEHIKQAGIKAIEDGITRYTPVDGMPRLKAAIQHKFKRDNDLDYELNQVLVSTGGKQGIYNLCQAVLNEGDEAIIPAPYWVSYPDIVTLAGAKPIIVEAGQDTGFKLTPTQLDAALNDKTRLFFINSPSNPTGVMYSEQELAALGEVLLQYPKVIIATDDIYEHILFDDNQFVNIINAVPKLYDRCVILSGASKAYCMTGWRIGFSAGPAEVIAAMKKVQSQSTSNPCSVAQAAAIAALEGDLSFLTPMLKAFSERHQYVVKRLNEIDGVDCLPSDGTFYSFPNVEGMIARVEGVNNDTELCSHILDETGVSIVPGSAFGLAGHMRLSYATSMENLEKALDRIASI
jgi:aspartate aminotransferase